MELIPLFRDGREDVRLERWAPNGTILLDAPGGAEFLVLEGSFADDDDRFEPQSWLRLRRLGSYFPIHMGADLNRPRADRALNPSRGE